MLRRVADASTVITAGTSDLPVAEEARETLEWMGVDVQLVADVGVAGPHRLPARLAEFADADAIVVVAGMEGALPSVVGGYVPCPVFAVPTSVGYGASLGGIAAAAHDAQQLRRQRGRGQHRRRLQSRLSCGARRHALRAPRGRPHMTLRRRNLDAAAAHLRRAAPDSHKGDYGRVLIVAGSRGMAGAAALAGMATLRSGAGLVTVATPASVQATVASFSPCYMTVPLVEDDDGIVDFANIVDLAAARDAYDVWAIGPGLGRSAGVDRTGCSALSRRRQADGRRRRRPQRPRGGAGAESAGARQPGRAAAAHAASRRVRAARRRCSRAARRDERADRVAELCQRDSSGRTVVLLKGHETVISDGRRYSPSIAPATPAWRPAARATALPASLRRCSAQGLDAWDAARLAAHVHGLAGDLAAAELGQVSLIASDLIDYLPAAFSSDAAG